MLSQFLITTTFVVSLLLNLDVGPGTALVQNAAALGVATSAVETEGLVTTVLVEEAAAAAVVDVVAPITISQIVSNMKPLLGDKPSMLRSSMMARGTLPQFQMVAMIS